MKPVKFENKYSVEGYFNLLFKKFGNERLVKVTIGLGNWQCRNLFRLTKEQLNGN